MSSDNQDELLNTLVTTIRSASSLSAQDIDFYRNLDSNVNESIDVTSSQVLSLINDVLLSIDENNDLLEGGKDSLQDSWKLISNVLDNLFEKSDQIMDNLRRGLVSSSKTHEVKYLDDADTLINKDPSKRIVKPQLNFKNPVDNTELNPFKPLLREKVHGLKDSEMVFKLTPEQDDLPAHHPHPYEYEIDMQEYNPKILQKSEPLPSTSWEKTEAIWVDNIEGLKDMLKKLSSATEVAVDLEHHDYRSYYGIVCLMQISDRNNDWIIDTIALRDDLQILNTIFTNPSITKVFHGAFMDIIWLQRDLGLYIVSLFDTYHASRLLGFPKHSLAYLLEKFANFKTSKKYQLADWRIRPLSKPMLAYARADTHFLLNIFDQLKNMLLEQNKMPQVLHQSRNVAKRRFEYSRFRPKVATPDVFSPIEKDEPWKNIMYQYNIPAYKEPLMQNLYEWRDKIARRDDESPRYIMPNQLLVSLVANAPTDPAGVVSANSFVPDHVRSNSKILANLIKRTMEELKDERKTSRFKNDNSAVDLSEVMTTHQIENLQLLLGQLKSNLKPVHAKNHLCNNSLLFTGSWKPALNSILYSHEDKRTIHANELNQRRKRVIDQLENEYVSENHETIHMPISALEDAFTETQESKGEDGENLIVNVESDKAENMDEIVILKKRPSVNVQKRPKTEKIAGETFDYESKSLLLNSSSKRKESSGNKRKRFDPYAVENVGPAPAKKKKKQTLGKNISFKK